METETLSAREIRHMLPHPIHRIAAMPTVVSERTLPWEITTRTHQIIDPKASSRKVDTINTEVMAGCKVTMVTNQSSIYRSVHVLTSMAPTLKARIVGWKMMPVAHPRTATRATSSMMMARRRLRWTRLATWRRVNLTPMRKRNWWSRNQLGLLPSNLPQKDQSKSSKRVILVMRKIPTMSWH